MTSSVNDSSGVDEQHKQLETHTQNQSPATGIFQSEAPPYTEYMMPSNLEVGHAMAHAAYPYPDPYYRSIFTPYSAQMMIPPPVLGIQQAVVPLPSSDTVEEPVYVNVKQYHGIMRRRQSRAKAESENKLVKSRKPYLHESRHLHAQKRARGCGGRFLNGKIDEKQQNKDFPCEKEQINDNGKSDSDLKPDENPDTSCNRQANTDQGR